MLTIPPPVYKKRPARVKPRVPIALTLVSATYTAGVSLRLTFNQPISVGTFNGNAFSFNDSNTNATYNGNGGATLSGATSVVIGLIAYDDSSGGVVLTVTPGNGIIATGDGQAWSGVTGLSLPFP